MFTNGFVLFMIGRGLSRPRSWATTSRDPPPRVLCSSIGVRACQSGAWNLVMLAMEAERGLFEGVPASIIARHAVASRWVSWSIAVAAGLAS